MQSAIWQISNATVSKTRDLAFFTVVNRKQSNASKNSTSSYLSQGGSPFEGMAKSNNIAGQHGGMKILQHYCPL